MENIHCQPQASPPSSTPTPSILLQLAGFLTKHNIHVEGDAGKIHFTGHFNIHNNQLCFPENMDTTTDHPSPFNQILSLLSPNTPHEEKDRKTAPTPSTHLEETPGCHDFEFEPQKLDLISPENDQSSEAKNRCTTSELAIRTTRLRSGVISPVSYFSRVKREYNAGEPSGGSHTSLRFSNKSKCGKFGRKKRGDLLERMFRRRSLPVRPCSSYTLFVMDKWASVKSSSFLDTSKRLGLMWAKLPDTEKKVFVDMALKDHARYKKQCLLLKKENDYKE